MQVNKGIRLEEIPCIKDQAYFIMVGIEGSWLYEATYPNNQDETWCAKFVKAFVDDNGWERESIQQSINDSYEWIMSNRLKAIMDKVTG